MVNALPPPSRGFDLPDGSTFSRSATCLMRQCCFPRALWVTSTLRRRSGSCRSSRGGWS